MKRYLLRVTVWIVYLSGCYFGYLSARACTIKIHKKYGNSPYTQGERLANLAIATTSWLGYLTTQGYIYSMDNTSKPASW